MPKKKVSFESDVLKQEFAAAKPAKGKKYYYVIYALIAAALITAVGYYIYLKNTELSVDWYGYGKALASLKEDHSDYEDIIIAIGDDINVTKEEYYKLKILNDYTFDGLIIEYNKYIEKNGENMTAEEKAELKPEVVSDDEILESIINTEIGYLEAMKAGVHMDYATAYSQVNANYLTYKDIMDIYEPQDELYIKAEESIKQMELVASGMGVSIDEYIEYLARDSIKILAAAILEEQWQSEFKDLDFDGTVDDYISYKYDTARENYTINIYGLG